jgi:CDP-diacylglycerol--glycerol-3-phosphate 3-phosphatidyltransferase
VAACLISLGAGGAVLFSGGEAWSLFLLPPALFVRLALNAIDGMLARQFGGQSRLGAILNELGDVMSDATLYLPMAVVSGISTYLVSLAVVVGIIAEMAGVAAIGIGSMRRYDGPFGKSDRALFFGALALALAFGIAPGLWSDVVLAIAAGAGMLTIVNRVRAALADSSR